MTLPSSAAPVLVVNGDSREVLAHVPPESIDCCVTSPPYFSLRDYHCGPMEIGRESSPETYVENLLGVFGEVKRVLKRSGTLWVVIGDSYASSWPCQRRNIIGQGALQNGKRKNRPPRMPSGLKDKDLLGIPWRLAFALQAQGWFLRSDIIWSKPNPMPESVMDRPTKAHEYVFLLAKSGRYFYDAKAIKEPLALSTLRDARLGIASGTGRPRYSDDGMASCPSGMAGDDISGRNKRSVWTIRPEPSTLPHFAMFPSALVELCIKAGCPPGGVVLDPFCGCGRALKVALSLGNLAMGIDLNPRYCELSRQLCSTFLKGAALA